MQSYSHLILSRSSHGGMSMVSRRVLGGWPGMVLGLGSHENKKTVMNIDM